jgi:hypothetical protein
MAKKGPGMICLQQLWNQCEEGDCPSCHLLPELEKTMERLMMRQKKEGVQKQALIDLG